MYTSAGVAMELRHLRYLVAVAEAGTFVRAAERLHVAQPALTRQIHGLEKELDVALFDRGTRGARGTALTSAGEACVRIARHVIQDTGQAVARARLSSSGIVGRCVIAAGAVPLITGFVAQFVARMRAAYPGIQLVIEEMGGRRQWEALERTEADIGLGMDPPDAHSGLAYETQEVHVLDHAVISSQHALAGRTTIGLYELSTVRFLWIERLGGGVDAVRDAVLHEMKRRKFPAVSLQARELPSAESLYAHVRAGRGWTLASKHIAGRMAGVAAVPLTDFRAELRTARLWRRDDTRPVTQTVLRELRRSSEEPAGAPDDEPSVDVAAVPEDFVPARLDLRHLRSFQAVAKYGSLGRAAESMNLSQPALSRQMQELEHDVGVPLLERGPRGMELSPAGQVFLADVESLLSVVEHVPVEARRAKRGAAQRCVIGAVPHPYVDRIIANAVAELESRESRVRIGLRSVVTPRQAEALTAGEIDVAIGHEYPVPEPTPASRALVVKRLFHDRICVALLAAGHELARHRSLTCVELATMPFLWMKRSFFPRFYDAVFERFAEAGVRPRVEAEYDGLQTVWTLVAQGSGWTLGWESHLDEPPPGTRAVPLLDFSMPWGAQIAYRQDEARAPVLAAIDCLTTQARELTGAWHTAHAEGGSRRSAAVAMF